MSLKNQIEEALNLALKNNIKVGNTIPLEDVQC